MENVHNAPVLIRIVKVVILMTVLSALVSMQIMRVMSCVLIDHVLIAIIVKVHTLANVRSVYMLHVHVLTKILMVENNALSALSVHVFSRKVSSQESRLQNVRVLLGIIRMQNIV